jgi:NDP-sugar pyrophosphorylase family protein
MKTYMMAAGEGKRFLGLGYRAPKPYITVRGVPMHMHVHRRLGLENRDQDLVLVTQSGYREHVSEGDLFYEDVRYIPDMTVAGPIASAVMGSLSDDEETEVLFLDCDCYVTSNYATQYGQMTAQLSTMRYGNNSCGVFSVEAQKDDPGCARVTRNGDRVQITEGGVIRGQMLNVGAYWFKSLRIFRRAASFLYGEPRPREMKMSDAINHVARYCGGSQSMELDGEFTNIGTPELLIEWLQTNPPEKIT